MRIEQIIAAVTRLVSIQVREIRNESFAIVSCLHSLWQTRMPLGMSCYSAPAMSPSHLCGGASPTSDAGRINPMTGRKRGSLLSQFSLATATGPAGTAKA